jgi:pimeloyl-ACP methyl ester carboxylesterase
MGSGRGYGFAALAMIVGFWASDAVAGTVDFKAGDGAALRGSEYGKGANGVVLVHDKGKSSGDWTFFAEKLAASGFHVLSVDLRGHGASPSAAPLTDADYPKMSQDVVAAAAWLRSKGATRVAVVGANFGANAAMVAAAEDPRVDTVALLSPGLNLGGIAIGAPVEKYGDRPLLVVASSEDAYAVRSVTFIDGKALGDCEVQLLENAGSGVRMLNRDSGIESTLLSWLNGSYKLQNGQRPAANVNTGDKVDIQTSGKKFGE